MLFMADHGRGRGFPPSSSHSLVTTHPNLLLPYQSGCKANFFNQVVASTLNLFWLTVYVGCLSFNLHQIKKLSDAPHLFSKICTAMLVTVKRPICCRRIILIIDKQEVHFREWKGFVNHMTITEVRYNIIVSSFVTKNRYYVTQESWRNSLLIKMPGHLNCSDLIK